MRLNRLALLAILSIVAVAAYVTLAGAGSATGFPLDDAWIHQTYARNLAESGQLAFIPGQPSAGSTSPFWTLLVAAGYALRIDYRLWTYALGALSLALCAWSVVRLSLRLWPDRPRLAQAAGLLCVFEWHLVWAAASGMETVLFAALALAVIERAVQAASGWRAGLAFGVLGGLLTVTRPEGLTLVFLAGLLVVARSRPDWTHILSSIAGFLLPVAPAVWLNLQASGTPFPNTFYAKQQEYAVYFGSFASWLPRALDVVSAPFIGAQILLLPGFLQQVFSIVRIWRARSMWMRVLPVVWVGVHLGVYVLRLPATYQHGRYLIPVIPIVLLLGLHGSRRLLESLRRGPFVRRVLYGSLIAATAAFWVVGAGAYRADVNVIQNELVASARWVDAHTPPDALIAAHDIGALGYFARRPLLDLAGLISPEVIPIIRNEPALLDLMRARRAGYLAVPPGFYHLLPDAPELQMVFVGDSPFAVDHWTVFRALWP